MQFVRHHLNQVTAMKSVRPAMDAGEAADAEVKAAESKRKRDARLASIPPEELAEIYESLGIPNPALAQKIGTGTIATALNPAPQTPMMLISSGNASSPALLGNQGSAVNQGQALQSGTSNLNDAKSRQNNAPPMVLQSSANNSKTTNNKTNNNYTSGNVPAYDNYDPFSSQMPGNAAK